MSRGRPRAFPPAVAGRRWLAWIATAGLALTSACGLLEGRQERRGETGGSSVAVGDSSFAGLVADLSEPGGYFDTDNLISNEASYLHVVGSLREMGVRGGAYVGVGPDQNFSYIAHVRPRIAFIVDLRRDNLLQQLYFKALFGLSANRVEYLCLLFGKPVPPDASRWGARDVKDLVAYLDSVPTREPLSARGEAAINARLRGFGVPLSDADLATISKIRRSFIEGGLDLRFTSFGRAPRAGYPTYRQLLLERDLGGREASFVATEDGFQYVRSLQARDLVVPVVGDLAGDHALRRIGETIARRGEKVSAFYTSNVEFYLVRGGKLHAFAENARRLPRDSRSVIIRSVFSFPHPSAVRGYLSTQVVQRLDEFVEREAAGAYGSYWELAREGRTND